jgi:hypothetical protein
MAKAFTPLRVHMPSGRGLDIRQPEMVRVGTCDIIIFMLAGKNPVAYRDWDTVGVLLIESISHL